MLIQIKEFCMQEGSIDKIKLINYELRIVYKTDSIEFYFKNQNNNKQK